MLIHPTLDRLHALQLHGMARAFEEQLALPEMAELGFADWNGDQRFELVRVPKLKFGNWKTLNEPGPRYRESASTGSHGGFRKELIYQGVSGNVIRLAYREYAENMARPA